jgi:hypothetical protein
LRGKRLFPFSELLALALLGKILLLPAKSGSDGGRTKKVAVLLKIRRKWGREKDF